MAKPLIDVHCITEDGCEYPVAVRIAMDDGSVQTYDFRSDVSPQFRKMKETFDESLTISIGYQFRPRKRRNRIHRWHDGHG